jgi:hypothetical protein
VKSSKTERLRLSIQARVQFYGLDELRQFFAAAAKFLITRDHWDDPHPTTAFDNDAVIRAFHEGFEQFSRADMLVGKHVSEIDATFNELLKQASGWNGADLNFRVAKRKLTRLRQLMQRFIRSRGNEEQPLRGLRFYEKTIRTKYLAKTNQKVETSGPLQKGDATSGLHI